MLGAITNWKERRKQRPKSIQSWDNSINPQKFIQPFLSFLHSFQNNNRVRIPVCQGISERLPMLTSPQIKENNLPLEENKHVDENELATGEEWKLRMETKVKVKQTDIQISWWCFNALFLGILVENMSLYSKYSVVVFYRLCRLIYLKHKA